MAHELSSDYVHSTVSQLCVCVCVCVSACVCVCVCIELLFQRKKFNLVRKFFKQAVKFDVQVTVHPDKFL